MNELEPLLKPLVLDLLLLIERTQELSRDRVSALSDPLGIERADELVRNALAALPVAHGASTRDEELEALPPALPTSDRALAVEEGEFHLDVAPEFAAEAAPSNDWLLGDGDGFTLS